MPSTDPSDLLLDAMATMAQLTALRCLAGWNALELIPTDGISYSDLAKKVDADENLITRLARMLVATGVLEQVGPDRLAHTKTSETFLGSSPLKAVLELGFDSHLVSLAAVPEYLRRFGRHEPDRHNPVLTFAAGNPGRSVWEHMNGTPARMATFMTAMAAMGHKLSAAGPYRFGWLVAELEAGRLEDRVLLVDVGGGGGHILEAIGQATPGLPLGRCVVQDLPEVVEEARGGAKGNLRDARFIAADFYTEQPVKAALVYLIRRCLHDYADADATRILRHLRDAMAPDSRLLIVELLLDNPPSAAAAATDIVMATLGGKERTLDEFRGVISAAGLRVQEVYQGASDDVATIECVRGGCLVNEALN